MTDEIEVVDSASEASASSALSWIEPLGTARVNDRERDGLRWLLHAAPWCDYVTVARCWNRVREARNVQALARMRKGDSSAGLPLWLESWEDQDYTSDYFATQKLR